MKIQIASDIHTEKQADFGKSFAESMDPTDVDVFVLAGDIGGVTQLAVIIPLLAEMYPHLIFVCGNHEHYSRKRDDLWKALGKLEKRHPNFHWLRESEVEIDGVRFAGTTLWFPDDPFNSVYESEIGDFAHIPGFRKWVYQANTKAVEYLKSLGNGCPPDVVVTHHAPTTQSITPRFRGDNINRFFVTPLDRLISYMAPKLWVHGHMHESLDYMAGDTRIVCNPFGYAWTQDYGPMLNVGFEDRKIVEI
jgi:Icc-related predicted phosphoesterase